MGTWPFEGRTPELTVIHSAVYGTGIDTVLLTGPAGVGKTRLARHALASLNGIRIVWVGATRAAAGIPFGAVAPLLPGRIPDGGPLELIRASAAHVGEWGGRHRVAIGVDDAHLLDDPSSTLIAHLVTERLAFVVLTARDDAPVPDVLMRLAAEGNATRVTVPPLPDDVIDRLIDHAVGEVGALRRRRLRETARGNPLALRELVHGAGPGGLTDLVTARLAGLGPAARYAVELVACGEPLELSIVERLAGLPAVNVAERSGLVVVEKSGARTDIRLHHPLYGEVLRSGLALSTTRQVYRALAEALLTGGLRRRDDAMRAALWQVEGGRISRPEVVRAGARQAVGHASLELAERLARAARDAEPGQAADRLLAEILAYRGRTDDAVTMLPPAPPAESGARTAWAITRAIALYWGGDPAGAWAVLDAAAGQAGAEATRSWLQLFDARCADAVLVARAVLDDADAEPSSRVWAAAAGSAAAGFLGDHEEAAELHRQGIAATRQADNLPWAMSEVDGAMCLAHLAAGRPAAARAVAQEGYRAAVGAGVPMMISGWAMARGIAAAACGHLAEADRLLAEASAGFETDDSFRAARCCLAAWAATGALRGDRDAGARMALADTLAHASNRVFEPWVGMWRGWVACAAGDLSAAVAAATRAADLARELSMPVVEALARYEVVRLGGPGEPHRLDAVGHELAGLLAGVVRALATRDGTGTLESAAGTLEARGYDLHAAELYAVAVHRHRGHGRLVQSGIAMANAERLDATCSGARTPLLRLPRSSMLTPREREVLLLAVRHTSAAIADRLRLAVPTVNNNLARAYSKLGITGRTELRALLDGNNGITG